MAILACESNVYAPPPPPRVTVTQPSRQPVMDYLNFTGNTQAINTVQLKARVQGFLEKILFQGRRHGEKRPVALHYSAKYLSKSVGTG